MTKTDTIFLAIAALLLVALITLIASKVVMNERALRSCLDDGFKYYECAEKISSITK